MLLHHASRLAQQLMAQHGLLEKGWKFTFDSSKRRAGCCNYRKKQISLSTSLTRLWEEHQVQDTILHEIAHALVGGGKGHGPEWKAMAARIGAKPERCYSATDGRQKVQGNWIGHCPAGHEHSMHKEPQRVKGCGLCSKTFSKHHVILWYNRHTGVGPTNAKYVAEHRRIFGQYD